MQSCVRSVAWYILKKDSYLSMVLKISSLSGYNISVGKYLYDWVVLLYNLISIHYLGNVLFWIQKAYYGK